MQVKYSIFRTNNVVYFFHMLYFLNKSSLVKNCYLSSVLHVGPVTYIMTNNFFCLNLHLLTGMKPVTSSSPEIYLAIFLIC